MVVEVHMGDEVRLRKPHACGGSDWTIVRLGADIGLRCHRCRQRVLLPRSVFERRLKTFLTRAVAVELPTELDVDSLTREGTGSGE